MTENEAGRLVRIELSEHDAWKLLALVKREIEHDPACGDLAGRIFRRIELSYRAGLGRREWRNPN